MNMRSVFSARIALRVAASLLAGGVAMFVSTLGCRQETILLPAMPDTSQGGGGGGGGGTVQRTALILTLTVSASDSTVSNALGWSNGRMPGATVSVHRDNSSDAVLTATTDSLGTARLDQVLLGAYTVSALRVLDSAERARLAPTDRDVDAVAGGIHVLVDTPSTVALVPAAAGRRGSLVVSEWWFPSDASTTPSSFYPWAGFVEIYNNSDTTIYLDGKIFGDAALQFYDSPYHPCADVQSYITDSLGLWAFMIYQFPGSGTEHPVDPGQAVVLATDAVDHTVVNPLATDLSGADFEFIGSADVDNPTVPNMINVVTWEKPLGHGWSADPVGSEPFVADHLLLDTLPQAYPYTGSQRFYRIPRAAVLDVATLYWPGAQYPLCRYITSPAFDRQPGGYISGENFPVASIQRQVSRILPGGQKVLQRTKTTAVDFRVWSPRTPGYLP